MQLFLRLLDGKTIAVSSTKTWTARELKSVLEEKEGFAHTDLCFIHDGKILPVGKTLEQCGVGECSFINLTLKLRGGCNGDDLEEAVKSLEEALRILKE